MNRNPVVYLVFVFALLFSISSMVADFHVTTITEFKNALNTAESNGADDISYMAAGTYLGNSKFISEEDNCYFSCEEI